MLRTVLENAPQGKRPLGKARLSWENKVKEYVEKVMPGMDWKEPSFYRGNYRQICWTTWS